MDHHAPLAEPSTDDAAGEREEGARQHVPVPAAIVVVQMHVEQAPRAGQERRGLGRPLVRVEGVSDIQRGAQVGGADQKTEGGGLAGRSKDAAGHGIVLLVLDAEPNVPVVRAGGGEDLPAA